MGSLNSDCWYMYTMKDFSKPITSEPDQTIEILMSELDQDIMDIFHQHTSSTAKEAREVCHCSNLLQCICRPKAVQWVAVYYELYEIIATLNQDFQKNLANAN